jgi:hypothetical protein
VTLTPREPRARGPHDGGHRARGPRGREFVLCPETGKKEQSKTIFPLTGHSISGSWKTGISGRARTSHPELTRNGGAAPAVSPSTLLRRGPVERLGWRACRKRRKMGANSLLTGAEDISDGSGSQGEIQGSEGDPAPCGISGQTSPFLPACAVHLSASRTRQAGADRAARLDWRRARRQAKARLGPTGALPQGLCPSPG